MKFFESPEFKKLQDEWAEKLQASGFGDIENKKQDLKQHNRRTIAFENQAIIRDFYSEFAIYLQNLVKLSPKHREMLELFILGKRFVDIAKVVNRDESQVRRIVRKHKNLMISQR